MKRHWFESFVTKKIGIVIAIIISMVSVVGLAAGIYLTNRSEEVASAPKAASLDSINWPSGQENHSPRYTSINVDGIAFTLPHGEQIIQRELDPNKAQTYEFPLKFTDINQDLRKKLDEAKLDFINYQIQFSDDPNPYYTSIYLTFTVDYQNKVWWISGVKTANQVETNTLKPLWINGSSRRFDQSPQKSLEDYQVKLTNPVPFTQPLSVPELKIPLYPYYYNSPKYPNFYGTLEQANGSLNFRNLRIVLFAQNNPFADTSITPSVTPSVVPVASPTTSIPTEAKVAITLKPAKTDLEYGKQASVDVMLETGQVKIDGLQLKLKFSGSNLQNVSFTPTLPSGLQLAVNQKDIPNDYKQRDNQVSLIFTLSNPVQGFSSVQAVKLGTLQFTPLEFGVEPALQVASFPPESKATSFGTGTNILASIVPVSFTLTKPKPTPTPVPSPLVQSRCWNQTVVVDDRLMWVNSCRGLQSNVACAQELSPLTTEELNLKAAWVQAGSKVPVHCKNISIVTPTNPAEKSDINGDGSVNLLDLSVLVKALLTSNNPGADLNNDGKVDIIDYSLLIKRLNNS